MDERRFFTEKDEVKTKALRQAAALAIKRLQTFEFVEGRTMETTVRRQDADQKGGLKRPEIIKALADFQTHMLSDPELGGAKGLPDLITAVNRITHYDDPRWSLVPATQRDVGNTLFMYEAGAAIPGVAGDRLFQRHPLPAADRGLRRRRRRAVR